MVSFLSDEEGQVVDAGRHEDNVITVVDLSVVLYLVEGSDAVPL